MYIKKNYLLVSYDSEKGFKGLLSLVREFNKVTVSNDLAKTFDLMSKKNVSLAGDLSKITKLYKITEKSAINYLNAVKNGSFSLKEGQTYLAGYQSYLKQTSRAATIADLKTKALTASMQILSTIGWMAAITTATWAIGKMVGIFKNTL